MATSYTGLKPRENRSSVYFQSRKTLIEHVSACRIQALIKGVAVRSVDLP